MIAQLKSLKNHPDAGWVDGVGQNQAKTQLLTAIGHHDDRVIGDAQVSLVQDSKLKIPLVKVRKTVKKSRLGKITEKLYNLEPCNLPEKPLNVDLGLYQMEDY